MRANGEILKPYGDEAPQICKAVREWAERFWTKEKIAEVGLAGFTALLFGFLFYCLYNGLNNQIIVGF